MSILAPSSVALQDTIIIPNAAEAINSSSGTREIRLHNHLIRRILKSEHKDKCIGRICKASNDSHALVLGIRLSRSKNEEKRKPYYYGISLKGRPWSSRQPVVVSKSLQEHFNTIMKKVEDAEQITREYAARLDTIEVLYKKLISATHEQVREVREETLRMVEREIKNERTAYVAALKLLRLRVKIQEQPIIDKAVKIIHERGKARRELRTEREEETKKNEVFADA